MEWVRRASTPARIAVLTLRCPSACACGCPLGAQVEAGSFTDSEILVMLGENGTGKTTFIRMLAGMLKPGGWGPPGGGALGRRLCLFWGRGAAAFGSPGDPSACSAVLSHRCGVSSPLLPCRHPSSPVVLTTQLSRHPPADDELDVQLDEFAVSYKPQKISPKFPGTVGTRARPPGLHRLPDRTVAHQNQSSDCTPPRLHLAIAAVHGPCATLLPSPV